MLNLALPPVEVATSEFRHHRGRFLVKGVKEDGRKDMGKQVPVRGSPFGKYENGSSQWCQILPAPHTSQRQILPAPYQF